MGSGDSRGAGTTHVTGFVCPRTAGDLISHHPFVMRLLLTILLLSLLMVLVCNGQRQPNRNNRNNRNNNRGQLRSGRQQQQPQRGRNNNRNNNRNNRNNQGGRKAKQSQCGGGNKPNHTYRGQNFLISWRLGCSKFTQSQGERFCRANNMRAVSLDSREKEDHFLGIVAKDRQRYFWTGGEVRNGQISWPSGKRYNDVDWSHTGGAKRPQPDNREGNEFCLAVLNNFYADGIRFHDVSCHHKKPVICQA